MTTPIAPLSFLDIQNEFGGGGPISLNEYYANGGLVASPPPTSPYQTSGISYGGSIDVGMFRGLQRFVQQPQFLVARMSGIVDRYTTFRLYLTDGTLTVVSSTSGWAINWLQIFALPTLANLQFGSASVAVTSNSSPRGVVANASTIVHNANAAEPYIDFQFDDEAPSGAVYFITDLYITLGLGAANPGAYTGPRSGGDKTGVNQNTWGGSPGSGYVAYGPSLILGTFSSQEAQPTFPSVYISSVGGGHQN